MVITSRKMDFMVNVFRLKNTGSNIANIVDVMSAEYIRHPHAVPNIILNKLTVKGKKYPRNVFGKFKN